MKLLQALPAGLHIAEDFPLAVVERTQLLVLQQFDVPVQDRERRLKVVGRRGQGIGGASGTLPELVVLLKQFFVGEGVSGRAGGRLFAIGHRVRLPRYKRFFWHHSHMWKTHWYRWQGEGTKMAKLINFDASRS